MANFGPKSRSLKERFWVKVEKTDGCWLWRANTNGAGYGLVFDGQRKQLAHRAQLAREFAVSQTSISRILLGKDHKEAGGPVAKKKARKYTSKLTATQVQELRARYEGGGVTYAELAAEYGVSKSCVCFAVERRNWNGVA